jgi:hypothetical protein
MYGHTGMPALLIIPSAVAPPARETGQAPAVQVERPTERTTWTAGAWSAGLAHVDGGRDDQLRPSTLSDAQTAADHPGAGNVPAGGVQVTARADSPTAALAPDEPTRMTSLPCAFWHGSCTPKDRPNALWF